MSEWGFVIGLSSLGVTVLIAIATATWTVSRGSPTRQDLQAVNKALSERIDQATHDYGETVHALRRKIEEVELWSRDKLAEKHRVAAIEELIRDYSGLVVKVETTWDFIMDRARIEARQGGFVKRESPLMLTELGKQAIAPIVPEVVQFCRQHPEFNNMSISQLEIELARVFRHKLAAQICEPNHIYMGACMVLLIEALKLEHVIPANVA